MLADNFALWSLEEQKAHLREQLTEEALAELLVFCAGLADSAPLLSLMRLAQSRGYTLGTELGEVFLELSTSALQKLLEIPGLERPVQAAWSKAGVDHLVSFALLDRYMRRRAGESWRQGLQGVARSVESRLQAGEPPGDSLILRLEGKEQKRLQNQYPEAWQAWEPAWRESAERAIGHLAARPRGVSLANAEKLLSQQVYTDQGHFLLELLQNADDSGATDFQVHFESHAITVSHNGAPFDFRDLVGVLSIGQTTKTERQIGYFGVGFKSVFEVTERPRISSGQFAFEIVDISIPRILNGSAEPDRTVLVLPLKEGLEVEPFYRRALGIDCTLLLNLPHVQRLQWTGPDGTITELSQNWDGDFCCLACDQVQSRYLVWRGQYQHQGERPEGKPMSAEVMLAFPFDEKPLPEQNLFSFLPIQENSGLRFLVGSHFDVPVDRERLDQHSDWNRGILALLPELVVRGCRQAPEHTLKLLSMLPLPEDSVGPMFGDLSSALVEGLSRVKFVEGDNGDFRLPVRAELLEPELSAFFGVEESKRFLDPETERTRQWLVELGARSYDLKTLLMDLTRKRVPSRLRNPELSVWSEFHKLLLQSPSFDTWEQKLRAAPLFLDDRGEVAAARELYLLPPDWEGIFEEAPRTLWPGMKELPETETLAASLRVRELRWEDLLQHLRRRGLEKVRFETLVEKLADAPKAIQLGFLQLPLFTDLQGDSTPLARPFETSPGALIMEGQTPVELFPELRFCAQGDALKPLLEAYNWPCFTRSRALRYLHTESWLPSESEARRLREWMLDSHSEWATIEDLECLAGLRVFESSEGALKTLKELWAYEEDSISALLPDLPQLKPGSCSERLLEHYGLQHLLGQAGLSTLIERFETKDASEVLSLLGSRAEVLSRQQIGLLLQRPLLDGCRVAILEEQRGQEGFVSVAEPEFVKLFLSLGEELAGIEVTQRLAPLMESAAYPLLGLPRLIEILQSRAPSVDSLPELHRVLELKSVELHLGYSQTVLERLPIWECSDGQVRATAEIAPTPELEKLLALGGHQPKTGHPEALREMFPGMEPLEFLVGYLRKHAKANESLEEQPDWLNAVPKVDEVSAHLSKHILCVDSRGVLRVNRLFFAPAETHAWIAESDLGSRLLHPESSEAQVREALHLTPYEILERLLPTLAEEETRQGMYRYLQSHLSQLARDDAARELLLQTPIWKSAEGRWRCLDELILEPGLPDLGFDWYPHPEIPRELLEQVRDTFGVGRPDPESLFQTLLPIYFQALGKHEQAESLLSLMGKITAPLSGSELRRVYQSSYPHQEFELPLGGRDVPISEVYAPPAGLTPLSCLPYQRGDYVGLLRKLGLPHLPSVSALREAGTLSVDDARALSGMVEWVWEERPEELSQHLDFLGSWPWLEDGAGHLKAPIQLHVRKDEVEELIGSALELYPAEALPASLLRRLGVADEETLQMPQVLTHLRVQVEAGVRVSGRFYHYLDAAIEFGQVSESFLRSSLQELAWIWTDEAEYRSPTEVLGFPAYRYFGPSRGTWEQVHARFPSLARCFEIPSQLSPGVVLDYLREVADDKQDAVSHRLLMNCLAFLAEGGTSLERAWRVLPARRLPDLEIALVAAAQPGVVRSNSPTLAALFGQGGTLWVVETEDPELGESLDSYYEFLGIPRLRDAYTVEPDSNGHDVTASCGEQVSAFRELLGAVYSVLPRLRSARPEWLEGDWLADIQLKPFTTAGAIRVLEGLELLYELPGVSKVRVRASLAYDPESRGLFVSSSALHHPTRHAVELAEGLAECIYQGPGSENLVDLLNLLLLFRDREQMNAYLDQRHFPRPFSEHAKGVEPWRKRLGEILDYGLHQALTRHYPQLARASWERWRDPDWFPESAEAKTFLERLGIENPEPALVQALEEMMEGSQLRLPSVETEAVPVSREVLHTQQAPEKEESRGDLPPRTSAFQSLKKRLVEKLTDLLSSGTASPQPYLGLKPVGIELADTYQHPPEKHILYSERSLEGHSRYCLEMILSNFDSKNQRFVPGYEVFPPVFLPSGRTVQFSGQLTVSGLPLPVPLYGQLRDFRCENETSELKEREHSGTYRLSRPEQAGNLTYNVELSGEPRYRDFLGLEDPDPRLLATTVSLSKLPPDIRRWSDWARGSGLPHWQLADRATEFVRASYQYDLKYMESEPVRELMARPARTGENRFLDILHAGADGRFLGRGVCTELSAMLLEMLRHCSVPCALGRVWMLDQGLLHIPDHVVVLVLVPSEQGPYWLPMDPSGARITKRSKSAEKALTRLELLEHAAELLLPELTGIPSSADRRQRFLQDRLLGLFGHSDLLELFLECLANPGQLLRELGPEILELRARGYIQIDERQLFEVRVSPSELDSWF